jgi:hypothetical protein
MYYQDRLAGQGFSRVLIGGIGRTPDALLMAHRSLEERIGSAVERVDPTRIAALTDRIVTTPEIRATLAPLVGVLLRTHRKAVSV